MTEGMDKLWKVDDENGTVVFVLGAGCSADCGAPTMANFMRIAREYCRQVVTPLDGDYQEMLGFRRSCLRLSYVFDRWWDNIEDLFTQAHLRFLVDQSNNERLYDGMKRVIWDVYRRKRPDVSAEFGYDAFSRCLHAMAAWKRPRPVVLTTNYDLHLETSLIRGHEASIENQYGETTVFLVGGVPVYPGLNDEWDTPPGGPLLSLEDAADKWPGASSGIDSWPFEVIKLHGSVNWFMGERQPVCDSKVVKVYNHERDEMTRHFRCQEAWEEGKMTNPLIVPPTLGKTELPSVIRAQWERALHAFRFARLIVVAGYSFPETDTFMTRLMAEGIRDNDDLEGFVIVNSDDTNIWKNRVKAMFAQSWLRNTVEWCHKPFLAFAKELLGEWTPDSPAIGTIRSITRMG